VMGSTVSSQDDDAVAVASSTRRCRGETTVGLGKRGTAGASTMEPEKQKPAVRTRRARARNRGERRGGEHASALRAGRLHPHTHAHVALGGGTLVALARASSPWRAQGLATRRRRGHAR
jgi:hypothetical protein